MHLARQTLTSLCALALTCIASPGFAVPAHLDGGFNNGLGKLITSVGGLTDTVRAMVLQPNGAIVLGGHCLGALSQITFYLARYDANGLLDSSFNFSGKLIAPTTSNASYLTGLALQTDGKISVAGYCNDGTKDAFFLTRYEGGPLVTKTASSISMVTAAFDPKPIS